MSMSQWPSTLSVGIAGLLLLAPTALWAQAPAPNGPASLDRIRAALQAPAPRLRVPPPATDAAPMFRVEVTQYFSMEDPAAEEPADPTFGLPSAGELMMGGIGKLHSAVSGYKRRRAQGKARQEVADALAEFCAVHTCPAPTTPQNRR